MRSVLIVLALMLPVFGVEHNRLIALDSLNKAIERDSKKDHHVRGFIFGNLTPKSTDTIKKMEIIPKEELLKDTVKEEPRQSFTGNYITVREYDKDYESNQKRLEELEKTQTSIILSLSNQYENQKSKSDKLYENQQFILNLIESICGLLTVLGGIFGAFKAKDVKWGRRKKALSE